MVQLREHRNRPLISWIGIFQAPIIGVRVFTKENTAAFDNGEAASSPVVPSLLWELPNGDRPQGYSMNVTFILYRAEHVCGKVLERSTFQDHTLC